LIQFTAIKISFGRTESAKKCARNHNSFIMKIKNSRHFHAGLRFTSLHGVLMLTTLCVLPLTSIRAQNLVQNGSFTANAQAFVAWPGYIGTINSNNPTTIAAWTCSNAGGCGVNGAGVAFSGSNPFGPTNNLGYTYAFIQGSGYIKQALPLTPNTKYTISFDAAGRAGNPKVPFRVQISDNTQIHFTTQAGGVDLIGNSASFTHFNYTFTALQTFNGTPYIQLYNLATSGDNSIDYANVQVLPVNNLRYSTATVSPGDGRSLSISWSSNFLGWTLQSNSINPANSAAWVDVPGSAEVTNLTFLINPGLKNLFFRMSSLSANLPDFANDPLIQGTGQTIASVWSGVPVAIDLVTLQNLQIVTYYNASREMVVAARNLASTNWYYQTINSVYGGWDVHNYITMAVDPFGFLHVSGNMHNQPMTYFRSAQPVTNAIQFQTAGFMQQISPLWNSAYEELCTYPTFFTGPNQEFIFTYRAHDGDGSLGWSFFLKYDPVAQAFSNPTGLNAPFAWTNIYSVYPSWAINGRYLHVLYMWRATTDASSNFRLSYARTMDFTNWTDAFGRPLTLPISTNATFPIVDDVPPLGGLLNGQPSLSFSRDGVPLAAYHKYDAAGHSQVYVARPNFSSLSWNIVQLTHSSWTWNFSGTGALPPGGNVSSTFMADDPQDALATVQVSMTSANGQSDTNSGYYTFDEITLNSVVGRYPDAATYYSANQPQENASYVDSDVVQDTYVAPVTGDKMQINRLPSSGVAFADNNYYLKWETLPGDNRDNVKVDGLGNPITPTPSALQIYRTFADFDTSLYGVMFKPADAGVFGAFSLVSDSARSFGSYLSSPIGDTNNFAQWNFSIGSTGQYVLGGSACVPVGTNGSFWIQVDNGPMIDWCVSGYWNYHPVTTGASEGMTRFNLSAGNHTLRLYAQQPGTKVEYLWLNLPNIAKAVSLAPSSYSGFSLIPDPWAVSGYCLESAYGSVPTNSTAHFAVQVSQSGNYLLLGRTRALDAASDSFYLSLNSGAIQTWTIPITGTNWTWKTIGTNSLTVGILGLDVFGRQGGAQLDSFMLFKLP